MCKYELLMAEGKIDVKVMRGDAEEHEGRVSLGHAGRPTYHRPL